MGTEGRYEIVLLGDTSFGENYQAEYAAAGGVNVLVGYGYDHCLANFRAFLLNADLAIANLETPLTEPGPSPLDGQKTYVHWSDGERAPATLLDHNVRAVSLANNHTMDHGGRGIEQTLDALDRAAIAWFGAGLDAESADRPFVHEFAAGGRAQRLAVFGTFETRRRYVRDFAFYAGESTPGVSQLTVPELARRIQQLKREEPDTFIIVFPHWGLNYLWHSSKQTRAAHALIDDGADLIVGHGAHMLGGLERYNGAWTVYSLGNFVFNAEGRHTKLGVPPYSLVGSLHVSGRSDAVSRSLRLYPILSDNLATNYQPRFVTSSEFEDVLRFIVERTPDGTGLRAATVTGSDDWGHYLELPVT